MNKLFDLKNQIFKSDSYKFGHYKMMVPGVQNVYSYFESRENTISPKILWFGLQYKLKNIARVTKEHVDEAQYIINHHLGPGIFDRYMWDYIVAKYDGRLPLLIKALPEGSFVQSGMYANTDC